MFKELKYALRKVWKGLLRLLSALRSVPACPDRPVNVFDRPLEAEDVTRCESLKSRQRYC